jgi:hypothetical protein
MNIEELRYGNLIFGVYEKEEEQGEFQAECTFLGYDPFNNFFWVENLDGIEEFGRFEPIPLTEEWLVKFGFTDDVVNVLENDNFKISISYYDGWHLSYKEKQGFGSSEMYLYPANIDSVHSLQNLFHSFTGQELTLKQ